MDERVEVALKGEEFKRLLCNQFTDVKNKYGLKAVDIEILLYLSKRKKENTPSDIYRHIRINKGHISQGIDDLEKKGYITANIDPKDRRMIHYTVTDSSKEAIDEIRKTKHQLECSILKGLSQEEIMQYKAITCKILKNIELMLKTQ